VAEDLRLRNQTKMNDEKLICDKMVSALIVSHLDLDSIWLESLVGLKMALCRGHAGVK
jgi:hypothetical protein